MTEIGYGYGSEWHLMRFLGHHRDLLEKEIRKQVVGINGQLHWLDFGFSNSKISGDKELKGLSFLGKLPFVNEEQRKRIMIAARSYTITGITHSWQNWDAIFYTDEGEVFLVEAKAHTGELSSGNEEHGNKSKDEILRYMKELLPTLPVSETWLRKYYQLANRLATTALLRKHGIKAKTLCLFFENGYSRKVKVNEALTEIENKNASKVDFENAIKEELKTLGITTDDTLSYLMVKVFIDARGKRYTK